MAYAALALVVLLAGVLVMLARRRDVEGPTADWVVEPLRLLAPVEQELHAQLRAAFPQQVVLTQVSLARLLRMRRSGGSMRVFQAYLRMAVPFVVCSKEFMPLIVVDVHASAGVPRPSREQQKRAAVLQASGLVYLNVAAVAGAVPTADDLRQRVRAALQSKAPRGARGVARVAPSPARAEPAPAPAAPRRAVATPPLAAATASVQRLVRPLFARTPAPARQAKVA
jgi:hypothetical protein